MYMSSMNISITDDVYNLLKALKKKDESFSEVIKGLIEEKDISKCYGLLCDYKEETAIVEREALKARKQKWKETKL